MRIRRVRAGQIVWRQQSVTGVPNSAISVRVFAGRHKPIVWRQRPLAGTSSGAVAESATLADAVSAIFEGSVTAAESVTLSDTDAYPVTTFAQTIYRGRNPPIVWRQAETAFAGNSLTGGFSDALTLVAAQAASQTFATNATAESLTATDANSPVGGSSVVGVVDAETVSDSLGTVWDFFISADESLNVADHQTGLGGSTPGDGQYGGGGYIRHKKPHKRREEEEEDGEVIAPKAKPAKPDKPAKSAKPDKPTKGGNQLAKPKTQEEIDEEEQIMRILRDLL